MERTSGVGVQDHRRTDRRTNYASGRSVRSGFVDLNGLIVANLPDQRNNSAANHKSDSDPQVSYLSSNAREWRDATKSKQKKRPESSAGKLYCKLLKQSHYSV
jgi:hypothetical protein